MTTTAAEAKAGFRLGYRPELDGMRAVAVLAVMAFHASVESAGGGYLGVELFFVLSGFLITTLLVQERDANGAVRFGAFYARRALRLLPALGAFLAAALAYAVLRPGGPEVEAFGRDFVAAIAYVANWSIALESSFRTTILTHTWTLGIEEQFYLLWPVAVLWLLARRRGRDLALGVALGGAVLSTLWRSWLYADGAALPRISFGLDTRVGGLLLGAAIGLAITSGRLRIGAVAARLLAALGIVALAYIFLSDRYGLAAISIDPRHRYGEGILATDIAAAALLLGLVFARDGLVSRLLAVRPIVWIGKVSYGLYLWHPAVDQVLTPERLGLTSWLTQVVRLLVTAALVGASYLAIELPALRRKAAFERRRDVPGPAELERLPLDA